MSVSRRTIVRVALGLSLVAAGGAAAATTSLVSAQDAGTPTEVVAVTPHRILDTRNGVRAAGPVGAGQSVDVQVAGVGPVPADAVGVVLNLTGTQVSAPTFVTAWPAGATRPNSSVLNLRPGVDSPNGVIAMLGDGGRLSLYNESGSIDLIADVAGYLVAAGTGGQPGPVGPQGPAGPAAALGHQIVQGAGQVPANFDTGLGSATCPAGKVAVGGGAQANFGQGLVLRSSFAGAANRWDATFTRTDGGLDAEDFTVYVVCINAG